MFRWGTRWATHTPPPGEEGPNSDAQNGRLRMQASLRSVNRRNHTSEGMERGSHNKEETEKVWSSEFPSAGIQKCLQPSGVPQAPWLSRQEEDTTKMPWSWK